MTHQTNTSWTSTACVALLAAGVALLSALPADAGWRNKAKRQAELHDGHVVAYSRFGNGSVSAPVRAGRKGTQVQLPNGRWTYCRTTCSETLRVKTIDYDEYHNRLVGRGTFLAECGIFGCLDIGW